MSLAFYVVLYALLAFTVVDIARTPRDEMRTSMKVFWVVIVLLLAPLGCVFWFLFGRPRAVLRRRRFRFRGGEHAQYGTRRDFLSAPRFTEEPRFGWVSPAAQRPIGPDDDPEFLRELSERIRRENPDGPPSRS